MGYDEQGEDAWNEGDGNGGSEIIGDAQYHRRERLNQRQNVYNVREREQVVVCRRAAGLERAGR